MHNLDANKTDGEKARRQLHKNATLDKSWRQHPTKHQLYGHLPPITKTIQARRTRHAGHCWRNRDKLISDELLWTPIYGRVKAGWPARTYIQQLSKGTGCSREDLREAMNDRENWWERYPCWRHDVMMMMMILIVDFVVLVDYRIKLKENWKRDKYLDLARKLKNYDT